MTKKDILGKNNKNPAINRKRSGTLFTAESALTNSSKSVAKTINCEPFPNHAEPSSLKSGSFRGEKCQRKKYFNFFWFFIFFLLNLPFFLAADLKDNWTTVASLTTFESCLLMKRAAGREIVKRVWE
ncbi:hypothetical protein CEXT_679061 [Caerostris extrusa]|uniref:Uncharacterized protein n=1 Tax=Caerostris extrusa TaxID=172846 RepID=A0AAV4SNM8_CAEEX|nr:hypothetical protein CEXT_679061 [Caerostris extrusa]